MATVHAPKIAKNSINCVRRTARRAALAVKVKRKLAQIDPNQRRVLHDGSSREKSRSTAQLARGGGPSQKRNRYLMRMK